MTSINASCVVPAVRLWEVGTGRCLKTWELTDAVSSVSFQPQSSGPVLAVAAGRTAYVFRAFTFGSEHGGDVMGSTLQAMREEESLTQASPDQVCNWSLCSVTGGLKILHKVRDLAPLVVSSCRRDL